MTTPSMTATAVYAPGEIDFESAGKHVYEVAFHKDGTWGYVLVPLVVVCGRAGAGKTVVCFGGTHGNEFEGQVAVRRLAQELAAEDLCGRVLLVPRLNPPACEKRMRESPLDGGNMNRAFPGDPHGTVTFRIADFVYRHLFPKADVVLDIHAAGEGLEFALCTSYHWIDDAAQRAETHAVAELFDTPLVFVYSSEMASGLLTEEAEKLGKITVGGEFGHSAGVSLQGVRHAYEGMRNVLKHYGMLEGDVEKIDLQRTQRPKLVQALGLKDYIPAPVTGVYEPAVAVGTKVERGELLGRLWDFEQVRTPPLEVRAAHGGYLVAQQFRAPIAKGDTMVVVAEEVEP